MLPLFTSRQIYRTRAKVVSSKPIFNAGTERFVRDWRSAIITVTVRDQRHRQHDPILGVVPLKLSDILQTSSQVTRWYPLDGGIVSLYGIFSLASSTNWIRVLVESESLCYSELSRLACLQICWDGMSAPSNLRPTGSWPSIIITIRS